jgi:hypothetical protein
MTRKRTANCKEKSLLKLLKRDFSLTGDTAWQTLISQRLAGGLRLKLLCYGKQ